MPKNPRSNKRTGRANNRYASAGSKRRNSNSPKHINVATRSNRYASSNRPPQKEHGLGGEQIEGRQAVRELLLGQRRRVREIWIATDIEPSPVIEDILDLARDKHAVRPLKVF
ncbi:MAG: hypothetical protein RIS81_867 [Actinomycetota bacterium]